MSYRNDQWFTLGFGTGGRVERPNDSGFSVPFSDNHDFVYPARSVRTINRDGSISSTPLKRGYIRSLLTEGSVARKCQFQFNPASINQSVAQNSTIINFLQMDPYQYAQPMPGNVTFQFSLFFDRTMEVNNPERGAIANTVNAWENNSPSEIGVLHDLSSLFSIIGVGVSEYMDRLMQNAQEQSGDERATQFLNRIIDVSIDNRTEDAASSGNADLERSTYRNSLSELVNINKGNSAFLLPLPVRLVFSSLYIVEGLVDDIDILFTKFSTQMVPLQCSVNITLEAKYIGFAKEKTFFTHVLDDLKNNPNVGAGQYGIRSDIEGAHLEAVKADLRRAEISVITNSSKAFSSSWSGATLTSLISFNGSSELPAFSDPESSSPEIVETTKSKQVKLYFPDAAIGSDRISGLFDSGVPTQIEFNAKVSAWRVGDDSIKQRIRQAMSDVSTSPTEYGPTGQVSDSNLNTAVYASTYKTILEGVKESDETPNTFSITSDREGITITRNYTTVQELWSLDLTSGGRYAEEETEKNAVLSCSTAEEWRRALDGYIVSVPSTFGFDDRSLTVTVGGTDYKYTEPLSSQNIFDYWLIYEIGIAVNIDGKRSSRSFAVASNHVYTSGQSLLVPTLERVISLDWENN